MDKKTKTVLFAIGTLGLSYLAHKQKEKKMMIAEAERSSHGKAVIDKMRNGMIEMSKKNAEDSARMNEKILESAMTQKSMLQILNLENSQSTVGISNLKLNLKKPHEKEDEIPMIGDEEDEDFNDDENSEIFDSSPGSRKLNI